MKCPLALSLRVIPIPSRITRKSTRPRASDRSMCCQPGNRHGLSASETDRHRRYSIRMQPRWTMQDPRHDPNTSPHVQGAGRQGNLFSFRSRHKNVLDIPSYRSGDYTSLRRLFAFSRVDDCNRDFSQRPLCRDDTNSEGAGSWKCATRDTAHKISTRSNARAWLHPHPPPDRAATQKTRVVAR
jgi:hypothetical protein